MADPRLVEDLISVKRNSSTTPGVAFSAARSPDPVGYAQAASGFQLGMSLRERMNGLSVQEQMSAWSALREPQKATLRQVGYAPPHERPEHRSWWQTALGTVGEIAGKTGSVLIGTATGALAGAATGAASFTPWGIAAGAAAGAGIGAVRSTQKALQDKSVLEAGFWAGDDVLHAYRATAIMSADAYARGDGRFNPAKWSWSEWGRNWERTGDDTPDFHTDPALTLKQNGIDFPADKVSILADVTGGMNEFDLYGKYGLEAVQEVMAHPDFTRASEMIAGTQLSPARNLFWALGLRPGMRAKVFGIVGPEVDVFDVYTGIGDGLFRWYSDPSNGLAKAGGKALKARKFARLSVADAADVARVSQLPEVQTAYQRIASRFAEGGSAAVIDDLPGLDSPHLRKALQEAAPTTTADVENFFASNFGLLATLEGRASRYYVGGAVLPSLTKLDKVKLAVKNGVIDGAEALEFSGGYVRGKIGTAFRRAAYLTPRKDYISFGDPKSVDDITHLAQYALPRKQVNEIANLWVLADTGGKRNILTGLLASLRDQADNPMVKKVFDNILDGQNAERAYVLKHTGEDISRMATGAGNVSNAVFSHQLAQGMAIPNFRALTQVRREAALWRQIPGVKHLPDGLVDRAMQRVWKPLVLLRLGMPIRNAGEEVAREMLANGFVHTVRTALGGHALRRLDEIALQRQLGPAQKSVIQNLALHYSDMLAKTEAALAGEKALRVGEIIYRRHGSAAMPTGVSALDDAGGQMDTPKTIVRLVEGKLPGRMVKARFVPTGKYKGVAPHDDIALQGWNAELSRAFNGSPEFKVALQHVGDDAAAKDAVLDWLKNSPAGKAAQKASVRAKALPDGRQVGTTATIDEALEDWAERIVEGSKGLTHDLAGRPIPQVVDALKAGKVPDVAALAALPIDARPALALAQEMTPVYASWWQGVVEAGFGGIGKMIDSMSRRPIYASELSIALDELENTYRAMGAAGVKGWEDLWERHAIKVATERSISFIDRADVKTQFSQMNRNVFPFWHAKQQFLNRWARTIINDPSVVRRAQLTMSGIEHSGAVHEDANGEKFFYYPGVGWTHSVIKKVGKLFGMDLSIPFPVAMTGKIKNLSVANLDSPRNAFLPDVGPIGILSLGLLSKRFPEFDAFTAASDAAEGEFGRGRPLLDQLMPATVSRLMRVIAPNDGESQFGSALLQSIQSLEASGNGLKDGATALEQEEFLERARQHARVIMGLRAVFGFLGPAAPQTEFVDSLTPEFRELLKTRDFDEATSLFLAKNPDATAWTVFQTKSPTGSARVNPTDSAARFIADNEGLLKKYDASAVSWFLPQAPGEFSHGAWQMEMANHFRTRRSAEQMWKDIKVREAANVYYPSKRAFDAAYDAASSYDKPALAESWKAWKQSFLESRPLFREFYGNFDQRAADRDRTIRGVEALLNDPARPKVSQEERIRELVQSFRAYEQAIAGFAGRRDEVAVNAKRSLTSSFRAWGAGLNDFTASQMWNTLIEPTLPEE